MPSVLVAHPSADLYGSDRVLLESISAMVTAGWRVAVTVPAAGPLVAELHARGAEVHLCPTPVIRKSVLRPRGFARFLYDTLRSVQPAGRLIRHYGADGVYVNTITIPAWILLGRLMGRTVVCHVHEAEGSASGLTRRLISLPLVLANKIIVNSRFSLEVLCTAIPLVRSRATVVYNGVPGPAEVNRARPRLDEPVRLLFVGRLSPRKGPQVVIAAVAELRTRGVAVHLDLLGAVFPGYEWFESELAQAVASAQLGDQVSFLGFDADIWPHIAAADIVVVPSVVDEPFGNTAVESVLGSRPLIVSSTSGLKEASLGYASAESVEPNRPDLLADAVQQIVSDWDRYRDQAWDDSSLARKRHAPELYGEQILGVMSS